jgi:TolB protein
MSYEALVVMRADGSRKRVVYDGGELGTSHPAWSPDGRTIAFTHTDIGATGADPNLYVVGAAGGAARRVTDVGSQEHADWSPDGQRLAFSWALDLGTQDTRIIRPDGTGETRVTDDPAVSDGWPAWAPSGDRLAITRRGIWTVKPDGTDMRQVTRPKDLVADWDPNWQPR